MNFNPQAGHEQSGFRPAVIISNDILNSYSKLKMVCPITNTNKKHPFHIELDERTETTGVILCDQAKMLDIGARNAVVKESLPKDLLDQVTDLIKDFL